LNRSIAPPIEMVEKITFNDAEKTSFSDNINAFLIKGGKKDIVKIVVAFNAGRQYEPAKLVAQLTARMLNEGTENYTAKALAEKIDYYGATINTKAGMDQVTMTIFTMKKFLPEVMNLAIEILGKPTFPEKEFKNIIKNSIQKLEVNLEKTSYLASTKFYESLFSGNHPYGYTVKPEDYNELSTEQLANFYKEKYHTGPVNVYISGKYDDNDVEVIKAALLQLNINQSAKLATQPIPTYTPQKHQVKKNDALQAAIRIGMPIMGKAHPDRHTFSILNTVFGGYFGSRLMSNIREDKGYTYGIYASISSFKQQASFLISTEVGVEVCDDAVKEIFNEINRLKNEIIPEEELDLVRNYILGSMLQQLDGPFKKSATLKSLYDDGLDNQYIHQYIEKVKQISALELQLCAKQYFIDDQFTTVIARN